jgi:hypothetical protein
LLLAIERKHMAAIVICIFIILGFASGTTTMNFSITKLWNSYPITDHRPVQVTLSSTDDKDHLFIEIDAPFFNDPAPPSSSPTPGPYPELWNYEVVELFFLSLGEGSYRYS